MLAAWITTSTCESSGTCGVEANRAGKVGKAAADFAQKMAHLKGDFRVAAVDGEGLFAMATAA